MRRLVPILAIASRRGPLLPPRRAVVEEAYPLAAARAMLAGKALYRDIWFDKPPLSALFYVLIDARTGFVLRLAGALFVAFAAWPPGAARLRFGVARPAAARQCSQPAFSTLVKATPFLLLRNAASTSAPGQRC